MQRGQRAMSKARVLVSSTWLSPRVRGLYPDVRLGGCLHELAHRFELELVDVAVVDVAAQEERTAGLEERLGKGERRLRSRESCETHQNIFAHQLTYSVVTR